MCFNSANASKQLRVLRPGFTRIMASRTGIAVGLNHGHVVSSIPRAAKPVDRKGVSYHVIYNLLLAFLAWSGGYLYWIGGNLVDFPMPGLGISIQFHPIHPSSFPLRIDASIHFYQFYFLNTCYSYLLL